MLIGEHLWRQQIVQVLLVHTVEAVRWCVAIMLRCARCDPNFLSIGTLHLSVSHRLRIVGTRARMRLFLVATWLLVREDLPEVDLEIVTAVQVCWLLVLDVGVGAWVVGIAWTVRAILTAS